MNDPEEIEAEKQQPSTESISINFPTAQTSEIRPAYCHHCGGVFVHRTGVPAKKLKCPICKLPMAGSAALLS